MSATILWIISIDRYISIVNHKYYKLRKIPKFHLIFWGGNFVDTQKISGQHLTHWLEQNMTLPNFQNFVLLCLLIQEQH